MELQEQEFSTQKAIERSSRRRKPLLLVFIATILGVGAILGFAFHSQKFDACVKRVMGNGLSQRYAEGSTTCKHLLD